ncbi:MAG: hypothetical protein A2W61_00590 [Deltaproteobacteria bacterium RIFCSPLOWO2_01_44_7]|nr:MAG: hypothetical protein A2712_08855 [Deltaproteobacteria bacterium RIFCSPHIGHO2_01_FULL_43_49]OGQ14554.1 MAG: hypothetical protein A3D22_08145 [Deltaproteobacteria bacterium RIFCSPHIGHO2_02_FULL_44_53]OGQ27940.1 MAG: hypothetical protein A3D98_06855 [Deltaproteobacteria bacterium RIFCSPHIGHO2_12_FULL_44_21]OGQ31152.1 MAG: hypothetical protein A2979_06905 [Deltaproteobacteria bacterium RIFCSPLOWO2_01_FULL_45_74]OGQ37574.1 MAG: hypothetical protein A2W61_00590 [Deltaproteobacteria bacterium 
MGFAKLLQKKRLIVVCGLGGVGKTTLSAALAYKAALNGQKSLVITVDPAKRLAEALKLPIPCPEPKLVWKGKGEFYACLLDAKHTFDHLIEHYAPKNLRKTILDNPLYQQLSMMLAGTQEYMAMEKLYNLKAQEKFDLIVVDTPPARHAIDFLKAPMKLSNMLNDSIIKLMITPSLKIGAFGSRILETVSHLAGAGILEDIAHLMNISIRLLDGFTQRAHTVHTTLTGKECAFILTCSVTSATVSDAVCFRQELERLGFWLEGVLINRIPFVQIDPKEVTKALQWANHQREPIWQRGAQLLKEQQSLSEKVHKKLQPLLNEMPHFSFVPETPAGVKCFEDLEEIVSFL